MSNIGPTSTLYEHKCKCGATVYRKRKMKKLAPCDDCMRIQKADYGRQWRSMHPKVCIFCGSYSTKKICLKCIVPYIEGLLPLYDPPRYKYPNQKVV